MESISKFISTHKPISSVTDIITTDDSVNSMCDRLHKHSLSAHKFICAVHPGSNLKTHTSKNSETQVKFEDALYIGSTPKYSLYESKSVSEGITYVFLLSNGVKYTPISGPTREINVDIDPDYPKDTLKYYGELL